MLALLLAATVTTAVCPPPKKLTCDQLAGKLQDRCPDRAVNCPTPVPEVVYLDKECPPPVVVHDKAVPPPPVVHTEIKQTEPLGGGVFGGGLVYFHGTGLTAMGGYQWGDGLMLVGGPMWIPQNGTPSQTGTATRGCVSIPYTIPAADAKSPWGAQVLLLKRF